MADPHFNRRALSAWLVGLSGFAMQSSKAGGTASHAPAEPATDRSSGADSKFQIYARKAVPRGIEDRLRETVSSGDFGTGTDDDTDAFQAAIDFCQTNNRTLYVAPGTYVIRRTLTIGGPANTPIAITGDVDAPMQAGSAGPAAIIRWEGGEAPVFALTVSGTTIANLAVQNFGAATEAFDVTAGQHHYFKRLSFLPLRGSRRFSRAIFRMTNASFGYGRWETMWFSSTAPRFLFIDGGDGGGTPFEIHGRSIFESNAMFGRCEIVSIEDMAIDGLSIHDNSFNQQEGAELCIVETRRRARPTVLTSLTFVGNEIDVVSHNTADRMFQLKNCRNIKFDANVIQGGGISAIAEVINSSITSFDSNYCRSVGANGRGVLSLDDNSWVNAGANHFDLPTMESGIFNNDAAGSGIVPLSILHGKVFIDLSRTDPSGCGTYRLTLTANRPAQLIVSVMTDSVRGMPTKGQEFTVQLENLSGRLVTAITAQPNFKLAADALAALPAGRTRSFRLIFDGERVQQISPAVEIPN